MGHTANRILEWRSERCEEMNCKLICRSAFQTKGRTGANDLVKKMCLQYFSPPSVPRVCDRMEFEKLDKELQQINSKEVAGEARAL